MPTSTPHQQGRVNLGDLKSQIEKQLGPERTQRYFSCLISLLTQKLSKPEFNKLCLQVLGRGNIPLHNQLIRSILKNAYLGKTPPTFADKSVLKLNGTIGKKPLQVNDSASQFYISTANSLIQCNGNGILGPCDWKRRLLNLQGGVAEQPTKKPRTEVSSLCDQIPVYVKNLIEPVAKEDGEKTKENSDVNSRRTLLQPPLGIHSCPARVSSIQRFWLSPSRDRGSDDLCHSEDLRNWMEKLTKVHGLGVTLDCANLLNNALDIFLKRLIRSSFELAGAKSMPEQRKHPFLKQHGLVYRKNYLVSLHDFKLAMELNPQQLGEVWPLWFERLCIRSFGE